MGEGNAAKQSGEGGGGIAGCGNGGCLTTQNAGSVPTQRIAFKLVMAFVPHRYSRYLKQGIEFCRA